MKNIGGLMSWISQQNKVITLDMLNIIIMSPAASYIKNVLRCSLSAPNKVALGKNLSSVTPLTLALAQGLVLLSYPSKYSLFSTVCQLIKSQVLT